MKYSEMGKSDKEGILEQRVESSKNLVNSKGRKSRGKVNVECAVM